MPPCSDAAPLAHGCQHTIYETKRACHARDARGTCVVKATDYNAANCSNVSIPSTPAHRMPLLVRSLV